MSWQQLDDEINLWQSPVEFWWRDDDACKDSSPLRQLISLAHTSDIPVHLAVIPQQLDASLEVIKAKEFQQLCYVMQHGINHQSHATENQRKVELGGSYPLPQLEIDLDHGRQLLLQHFDTQYVDVLVPPWNRLSDELIPKLSAIGYQRLSVLGPRPKTDSIQQLNVHLDIINWKQRQFAGDDSIITALTEHLRRKRLGDIDISEPCGLMTHHLDHDPACWDFLERFFSWSAQHNNIHWISGSELAQR